MRCRVLCFFAVWSFIASFSFGQASRPQSPPRNGGDFSDNINSTTRVPKETILVKGAWASASDASTPLPEGGSVSNNVFTNQYFGMSYPFPTDWTEKYNGPPPSETGRYVLAQLRPADRKSVV